MQDQFFEHLSGFHSFDDACDPKHYHSVPSDWFIVITDVKGSTKAIEAGRYKDVNMVGAACIAAVVNTCDGTKIPYVFGGDGATFLIPPRYVEAVKKALCAVAVFSEQMHELPLRVGAIPVSEVEKQGKQLGVAKLIMETGAYIAMFNGGGASYADTLLKEDERFLVEPEDKSVAPNLEGLSCRWQPITTKRGVMLTLLVLSVRPGLENETYHEINAFITKTLDADSNPVNEDGLTYKWPGWEALRQSQMVWKQGNVIKNIVSHIFLIILFNIMNRFNLAISALDVPVYKQNMIKNSDYRKFDDMLRMVVDCTEEQAQEIEQYLEEKRADQAIVFGTHYSKTALMTCFLESLQKDQHVHFVDGNDGGYALAAAKMKQQLSQMDAA